MNEVVAVSGELIYILHNLADLDPESAATDFPVVVSRHSHVPKIGSCDGVLFINPGSAGPRRFKLPIALAKLTVDEFGLHANVEELCT